ncbi:hypothetical protein E2C01_043095 [Portunus trituberculatus]|uniref:Uncharacterized protein n=1 Tax=Portunus trituberculatus TaxID=210409 RepID=A0A5B7FV66_PORTR|nr:hypothetical protein [Portunus trituberculatus]
MLVIDVGGGRSREVRVSDSVLSWQRSLSSFVIPGHAENCNNKACLLNSFSAETHFFLDFGV